MTLRIAEIKAVVARHFKLTVEQLEGKEQRRELSIPRHIAFKIVRERLPSRSYPRIAREFGGRDHSTIITGIASIEQRMLDEPEIRDRYDEINTRLDQLVAANSEAINESQG